MLDISKPNWHLSFKTLWVGIDLSTTYMFGEVPLGFEYDYWILYHCKWMILQLCGHINNLMTCNVHSDRY